MGLLFIRSLAVNFVPMPSLLHNNFQSNKLKNELSICGGYGNVFFSGQKSEWNPKGSRFTL